jgi:hypothetical protein
MADLLPIALRAWSVPLKPRRRKPRTTRRQPLPRFVLVLDTETTINQAQALTFGSFRRYRVVTEAGTVRLLLLEEGLFHGDDLADRDPGGLAAIERYASQTSGLPLIPASRFIHEVLTPRCYKRRDAHLLVGFNLPFDLSRLASDWGEARGEHEGGFSFVLETYGDAERRRENPWRPRIAIKTIDSKRHLMGFTRPAGEDRAWRRGFRGHFLDCRTFAFALTNESHSLASACEALGVEHPKQRTERHGEITPEYIDYNRADVQATAEVFAKLLEEHLRHPIDLQPTKAFSPASIGKAYLRAMGIQPVLERQPDFPPEVLAAALSAFYGGRAEDRIRKVPMPVTYRDFLSMYATVNALMGLWDFVVAERIEVEEATEDVRRFLARVSLDDCLRPETWKGLAVLVQIVPDDDMLPVRSTYEPGGTWNIGINPLRSERPLWYALGDVVPSTLLTGRPPRVARALRLVPRGLQAHLRSVRLRGEVEVDPASQDFFRVVTERRRLLEDRDDPGSERLRGFLKVLANASSYGIYAEVVRHELSGRKRERVRVYREDGTSFEDEVRAVEEFGEFAFPPLATFISAGARLMLAILERTVSDAGGIYAFSDTDSMAIVSTRTGGVVACPGGPERTPGGAPAVRALSWEKVDRIIARFEALNPYDREAVPGSILKLEPENLDERTGRRRTLWCHAISAKRYALFNRARDGQPILRKWSEHGLGHLLNPTDRNATDRGWIRGVWERLVGAGGHEPPGFELPAVGQITVSSPHLLRPFRAYNELRAASSKVRPFNFLLSAHVAPFGLPQGADPTRFHLIAPFHLDPERWEVLPWVDVHSGEHHRVTTDHEQGADRVVLRTYRDVVASYAVHTETKSLGPDGRPCRRGTVGLLGHRSVVAARFAYIGKESNRLEDVEAGTVHRLSDVLSEYHDPDLDPFDLYVRPILEEIPKNVLARAAGIHPRKVAAIRNGHAVPRHGHRDALQRAAGGYARRRLQSLGRSAPADVLLACRALLELAPLTSVSGG